VTFGRRLLTAGTGGGITVPVPGFNPSVNVDSTTAISSGGAPTDWHGRAAIKRRGDDVLVLSYYRGQAHGTNAGALHIRFSDDDGATWTDEDETLAAAAVTGFPMNPPVSAGQDAGEPWLYLCPNGDLLIHMWRVDYGSSAAGTYQSRSTDGGETWDSPAGPIQFAGLTVSQNLRAFATDDDFVLDGTIYAAARVYVSAANTNGASVLITSDDDGDTWTRFSTIVSSAESGGGHETGIEYTGNDRIVTMIRDFPHTHSYKRISTNLGTSWGARIDATPEVGIAGRQRIYTRAHLKGEADWWDDPVLFMVGFVHQVSGASQSRRNCIWLSPDAGETWSSPFYIDTTSEDAGYGDMFYDAGNDQYVVVSYQGTLASASLNQYRLTVTGI
jgi:hypothetical protein